MIEYVLLGCIVVLLIIAIVLIIMNKPKTDNSSELIRQQIEMSTNQTGGKIAELSERMNKLTDKNYEQQIEMIKTLNANADRQTEAVGKAIMSMQESNEKKLDEMRKTVDEKLADTLDKRFNASFKTVSEQLQNVYKSLGEMKELSSGVTENVKGLNRVLTNVKSRGTWAEVQLGNILDQTIPNMYETNVKTNPSYNGQVEFAVKIPNSEDSSVTYLPIDSKFPMEDYIRLQDASEKGDVAAIDAAKKALERTVKKEAKDIQNYISVPETTPFAILYLATEGLYAEIMSSKSEIAEQLQKERIMLAGPSTITALLNSLAMGFKSVAINKKADEVMKVLSATKAQYEKFGDLLEVARKRIQKAGEAIDDAERKNAFIQTKLKNVETLESSEADQILGLSE